MLIAVSEQNYRVIYNNFRHTFSSPVSSYRSRLSDLVMGEATERYNSTSSPSDFEPSAE